MTSAESESALWPLTSGTWQPLTPSSLGFEPLVTAAGLPVAPQFFPAQWQMCMRYARDPAQPEAVYPPDFLFHPETGASLVQRQPAPGTGDWVAPFGRSTATDATYGLPETAHTLHITHAQQRCDVDDPDARLPAPPPGEYEFFSLPCATDSPLLLALERGKGLVYCYFNALKEWVRLQPDGVILNENHGLPAAAWRAEVVEAGPTQRTLFVPTDEGLACLQAHAPALRYRVAHSGEGRVVGAPIVWNAFVWALLAQGQELYALCCTPTGEEVARYAVPLESHCAQFVAQTRPIASPRNLVWLGDEGYVRLHRFGAGDVRVDIVPWPQALQPQFEFGSPYLAKDGSLWQLCQDANTQRYCYVKLQATVPEVEEAELPRLCVGSVNYRYSNPQRNAPWEEFTVGSDGNQTRIFVPLFAAPGHQQVLGVQLENAHQGLAKILRSKERQRAILTIDAGRLIAFGQVSVVAPWNLRCFIHNGFLWASHPQLNDIQGWELSREESI